MTMLMTLSLTAQAQFKMHPNGKLSVLTEETPLSPISFNGAGFADILFGVQGQGKVAAFKATKPTGNWSYASNFMNSGAGTNSSFVVSKAKNALLCVYYMNGKQLRQIALSSRGRSSVSIAGSELSAGMYLYCLIVDGKLINTRRMVLTK